MKRDPRVLLVLVTVTALSIGCASTSKKKPEDKPKEAKPAEATSGTTASPAPTAPKETPPPAPTATAKEATPPATPPPAETKSASAATPPAETKSASATPPATPPAATPAPKETPAPKATPAAKETPAPKSTPPAAKETPAPKASPAPEATVAKVETTRPPDAPPAAGASGGSGSVSGKIILMGDGGAPEKVLSGTVVYLPGVSRKVKAAAPTMASQNKAFTPHVIAVPLGQEVDFPNNDKIHHNAFSLSDCCKFDLGLYKNGASRKKTFDKEGVCRVYCNIHAQMSGVVVVTKGDANAVTGAAGEFSITDLPPGRHEIVAWHERARTEVRDTIEIVAGQVAKKELTIDVAGFKEQPHTKKDGRPYGKDDEATY